MNTPLDTRLFIKPCIHYTYGNSFFRALISAEFECWIYARLFWCVLWMKRCCFVLPVWPPTNCLPLTRSIIPDWMEQRQTKTALCFSKVKGSFICICKKLINGSTFLYNSSPSCIAIQIMELLQSLLIFFSILRNEWCSLPVLGGGGGFIKLKLNFLTSKG